MTKKRERRGFGPEMDLIILRAEAAPWAAGCGSELVRLWNAIMPKMVAGMCAREVPLEHQNALLDEAKKVLWAHHKEVLASWTRPYVEALLDQPKAETPRTPQAEAHHG